MTPPPPPRLSVIIPARNAAHYLARTLPALLDAWSDEFELIVVDDCSTDETARVAEELGAKVVRLKADRVTGAADGSASDPCRARGASPARNAGVAVARGDVLVFLDADVEVHRDTVRLLLSSLDTRAEIAAVFGSYDDEPADRHTVSAFKNLMHHYVHQQGNPDAATFWTGCGAIRRDVFEAVGPFNTASLVCAEDIDYGHRLRDAGHRIWLRRDIQCKHLKRWTLWNMVRTDVIQRGIPWTVMMLRRGRVDNDLNLGWRERVSAATVGGIVAALMCSILWRSGVILLAALMLLMFHCLMQKDFYLFLAKQRGWWFVGKCLPLHILYYCYSLAAVAAGGLTHIIKR